MILLEYLNLIGVACFGLILGSFSTALSYRVPHGIPWIWDKTGQGQGGVACRSACPYCHTKLSLLDLFPVFSWLLLRGRCRHCGGAFGGRYPAIELLTMLSCIAVYYSWGMSVEALVIMLCIPFLMALIVIDMDYFLLPNQLVFITALLGCAFVVVSGWGDSAIEVAIYTGKYVASGLFYGVFAALLGGIMSFVLKKDALGGGDVKFFAAAGIWLGPLYLPFFLLSSGVIGIIWALCYNAVSKSSVFPFGPALIITMFVALILKAYGIIPLVGADARAVL